MSIIDFGVLALGWMTKYFAFSSILFELIELNINLYLDLNLIYLELDLNLILVIK